MSLVLLLLGYFTISIGANQWNYGQLGPDIWSDHYPQCAGKSQSPINILTACTIPRKFTPFQFTSSEGEKHHFTLKNNGHTIIATINSEYRQSPVSFTGGGLNGTFEFVNFHLHWGENYRSGSEHQMYVNLCPNQRKRIAPYIPLVLETELNTPGKFTLSMSIDKHLKWLYLAYSCRVIWMMTKFIWIPMISRVSNGNAISTVPKI